MYIYVMYVLESSHSSSNQDQCFTITAYHPMMSEHDFRNILQIFIIISTIETMTLLVLGLMYVDTEYRLQHSMSMLKTTLLD